MNIESAKYFSFQGNDKASIIATINGKNLSVPIDENNSDFQAIQEWVAEGNKIEDAD